MTLALRVLSRVITRRMTNGEALPEILNSYPRLTPEQRAELERLFSGSASH